MVDGGGRPYLEWELIILPNVAVARISRLVKQTTSCEKYVNDCIVPTNDGNELVTRVAFSH